MEVANKFKGLDLIECLKNYGQRFYIVQEAVTKAIHKKKETQQGKMVVKGGLKWQRNEEKQKAKEKGKNKLN